ncbi:MAG: hypothetical protein AAGF19_06785 [Pseudomonadota bacterium]
MLARSVLIILGSINAITGIIIVLAPRTFYEAIPGLDAMGPFSVHFIRDVGLVYFSGGLILTAGGLFANWQIALCGALWFFLHGLFHVQVWVHRGAPFDGVFWFDFAAVIFPSVLVFVAALRLRASN